MLDGVGVVGAWHLQELVEVVGLALLGLLARMISHGDQRCGEVAYQLELPESLSSVHDVFHVSQLKKCLRIPEEQIPLEELTVKEDLTYEEFLIKILDTAERVMRSRVRKMCKVQWNRYIEDEATWEREEENIPAAF